MAIASVIGCVIYVDSDSGTILSTSMKSKMIFDNFKLRVKQLPLMNFKSNVVSYKIEDLDGMFIDSVRLGTAVLRFNDPRHQLMIQSDDLVSMNSFVQLLYNICIQWNYLNSAGKRFTPCFHNYKWILRINTHSLNVNNLNTLLLENIVLPSVPTKMDRVKVSYLSLTSSSFGSKIQQNSFWDWIITYSSTSLIHLEMDSMKLKTLPFDIMFMKKLQTLSLANNDLTYIPHFIGELDDLKSLYINKNKLTYLPGCLQRKVLHNINISDNMFHKNHITKMIQGEEIPVMKSLSVLSFHSLFNKRINFSRRDVPNGLWNYFYAFGRCRKCFSVIMSNNANEIYDYDLINIFDTSEYTDFVSWQHFECNIKCIHD